MPAQRTVVTYVNI